jgi:hypothetical protein
MSIDDTALDQLWRDAESSFWRAREAIEEPGELVIVAGPSRTGGGAISHAFLKHRSDAVLADPASRSAGEALARFASCLPLFEQERDGVTEYLVAQLLADDGFAVSVLSGPPESASVWLATGPDRAREFVRSRTEPPQGDDDWSRASRRRLLRTDVFGGRCVIEAGAVWFVEWLEGRGCETLFSCEGHPRDFHVVFRGEAETAHAIAGAPHASVEIFRSHSYPEPGQWTLRLATEPADFEDRNGRLRELAEALMLLPR